MNITPAIIITLNLITFVLIALTFIRLRRIKKSLVVPKPRLALSYSEVMGILNAVIEECLAERMFTLRFNEKPTIPPLDDELIYMTKKIIGSLSPELSKNIQLYLSNEFITRYISRNIRDVCMKYIEEVRSQ